MNSIGRDIFFNSQEFPLIEKTGETSHKIESVPSLTISPQDAQKLVQYLAKAGVSCDVNQSLKLSQVIYKLLIAMIVCYDKGIKKLERNDIILLYKVLECTESVDPKLKDNFKLLRDNLLKNLVTSTTTNASDSTQMKLSLTIFMCVFEYQPFFPLTLGQIANSANLSITDRSSVQIQIESWIPLTEIDYFIHTLGLFWVKDMYELDHNLKNLHSDLIENKNRNKNHKIIKSIRIFKSCVISLIKHFNIENKKIPKIDVLSFENPSTIKQVVKILEILPRIEFYFNEQLALLLPKFTLLERELNNYINLKTSTQGVQDVNKNFSKLSTGLSTLKNRKEELKKHESQLNEDEWKCIQELVNSTNDLVGMGNLIRGTAKDSFENFTNSTFNTTPQKLGKVESHFENIDIDLLKSTLEKLKRSKESLLCYQEAFPAFLKRFKRELKIPDLSKIIEEKPQEELQLLSIDNDWLNEEKKSSSYKTRKKVVKKPKIRGVESNKITVSSPLPKLIEKPTHRQITTDSVKDRLIEAANSPLNLDSLTVLHEFSSLFQQGAKNIEQEEASASLFLLSCSLRLSIDAFTGNIEELATTIPMLYRDCACSLEQGILASNSDVLNETHDLERVLKDLNRWGSLSSIDQHQIKNISLAIIWTRYVRQSFQFYKNSSQKPNSLYWVDFCSQLSQNKEQVIDEKLIDNLLMLADDVFATTATTHRILSENNSKLLSLIEAFSKYTQSVKTALKQSLLKRVGTKLISNKDRESVKVDSLNKVIESIKEDIKKYSSLKNLPSGNPILYLEEVLQHLIRFQISVKMLERYPNQKYNAWHSRNLFIQWIVEQLLECRLVSQGVGKSMTHNFKTKLELLGILDEEAFKKSNERLNEHNCSIAFNYPMRLANAFGEHCPTLDSFREMLTTCPQSIIEFEESKADEFDQEILSDMLNKALPVIIEQVKFCHEDLEDAFEQNQ